jgi:hypothetical protein
LVREAETKGETSATKEYHKKNNSEQNKSDKWVKMKIASQRHWLPKREGTSSAGRTARGLSEDSLNQLRETDKKNNPEFRIIFFICLSQLI